MSSPKSTSMVPTLKIFSQHSIPEIIQDIKNSQSRASALAIAVNEVNNSNKMLHLSTLRARCKNIDMRMKDFETMLPYFENPYRVIYVPHEFDFPIYPGTTFRKTFFKVDSSRC